ncbi:hypothetical protein, partial [Parabacteroides johnsonii]|uniref:hypothetical protein n=1 Tax=Parabacteroides johnsonii TaxID=387661 RepID=UPI00265CBD5C
FFTATKIRFFPSGFRDDPGYLHMEDVSDWWGGKCFFGGLLVGEYFGGIIGDFLGRMWNNSTYMDCDLGNKQFHIGYIVLRTSYIMFFNA